MKQYILLSAQLAALTFSAAGQSIDCDTLLTKELGQITVVAASQRTEASQTVYLPTSRQKEQASDGLSLLSRMQIPQLSVNPVASSVKTASQQPVDLFINFHPATDEDVSGLNPADVRRVEYLDFPADPRFMRAAHVVNFITRTYTYGGYTKLNGKERFFIGSGQGAVYSKFAHRIVEYDLILSGQYDNSSHVGSASAETYRLPVCDIGRTSDIESARRHSRELYTAGRVSLNKGDNLTLRSLISFNRLHSPLFNTAGRVDFTDLYASQNYSSQSPSTNNALVWDNELYVAAKNGWSANVNFRAQIFNNNTVNDYATESSMIENHADEDSWFMRGNAQVNKSLSGNCTLFANLLSGGGHTLIDYTGTSVARNRFSQTFSAVCLGMSLNRQKLSGTLDVGYALESNNINGKTIHDRYPFTHINLGYAPTTKTRLGLWFQYATFSPDATMKNPNIIRQSELMYISGNPDLKSSRNISASFSYTWLPSNNWQMTAYVTAFCIANRQIAVYTPDGPEKMMLKKYHNDGDYNHGQAGIRITRKLLDSKLSLSVAPRLLFYHTTGSNAIKHYPFMADVNADYYFGNFSINAYWDSPGSYVDGETAYLRTMPSSYSLGINWASGGWNIQLSAANMFRASWQISKDSLTSRWYDSTVRQFGSEFHRRLTLSITYTLNYGKRTASTGELTDEKNISTSILR
ncbi:MAG: hypothetical protein K2N28_02385 [Muribaculaceae bacterium]|nr:hypothetical protein [Muribaculaceae bacterium]